MAQGTIKEYDPSTKRGTLLDDGAQEFAFDHDSFKDSGVRLFRIGQRVKFSIEGEGAKQRIRDLRIVTM